VHDRRSGLELAFSKALIVDGRHLMEVKSEGVHCTTRVYSVVTRADGRDLLKIASDEEVRESTQSGAHGDSEKWDGFPCATQRHVQHNGDACWFL
jgi:hypothetical protein